MNWMNLPLVFSYSLCFALLCSFYYIQRPVRCTISGSNSFLDGMYMGRSNFYEKVGKNIYSFPDIYYYFELLRESSKEKVYIFQIGKMWVIGTPSQKKQEGQIPLFRSDPTTDSPHSPPNHGWIPSNKLVLDQYRLPASLTNVQCRGNLFPHSSKSNIEQLLDSPMNTFVLGLIIYIAYCLWEYRVEVSAVSFSYDSLVNRKEYWRAISASFAHFDLLHLGFNAMALYQLRMLETVYGSVAYGYISVSLVAITMLICVLLYHVLINQYNLTNYIQQQAVGYSCVLFAWMVALSVRLEEFCPIFLFPSFCMKTYYIPFIQLPVNIGPFVLLVFTSLIMPRASFIGHLSGIIIGYPLAWGLLNFLTLPLLATSLYIAYGYCHNLIQLLFAIREQHSANSNLVDIMGSRQAEKYTRLRTVVYMLIGLVSLSIGFYFTHIDIWLFRLCLAVALLLALQARYLYLCYDLNQAERKQVGELIVAALFLLVFDLFCSILNLSMTLLVYSHLFLFGLSLQYFLSGVVMILLLVIVETIVLILLLNTLEDLEPYQAMLASYHCDSRNIQKIVDSLNVSNYFVSSAFQGTSRRLGGEGSRYTAVAANDPDNVQESKENSVLVESKSEAVSTTRSRSSSPRIISV